AGHGFPSACALNGERHFKKVRWQRSADRRGTPRPAAASEYPVLRHPGRIPPVMLGRIGPAQSLVGGLCELYAFLRAVELDEALGLQRDQERLEAPCLHLEDFFQV